MIAAIILAAGESKRMNDSPKANLLIGGKTFLTAIVEVMHSAGINRIYVVLGKDAESIKGKNPNLGVTYVINKEYQKGQLRSIQAVLEVIPKTIDSLIIHLVDHPLINVSTVQTLVRARQAEKAPIIIPTYRNKRGHPVLFGNEVFKQLMEAPMDVGARAVVRDNRDILCEIETEDAGIVVNINTPEDYNRWCNNNTQDIG